MKVLVNGCSHSRACIPDAPADIHFESSWPRLLSKKLDCEVINLSQDGKSNHWMIEETIRAIINNPTVTNVVLQLTEFQRINLYKKARSGEWQPDDFLSQTRHGFQLDQQSENYKPHYVKIPGSSEEDLMVSRTIKERVNKQHVAIGDSTLTYEMISTASLLVGLQRLCDSLQIKLHLLPYFGFGDTISDKTFNWISPSSWIIENYSFGMYNDLLYYYSTPDTWHFEKAAHDEIANIVMDHITKDKKIKVNTRPFDTSMMDYMFIYD